MPLDINEVENHTMINKNLELLRREHTLTLKGLVELEIFETPTKQVYNTQ